VLTTAYLILENGTVFEGKYFGDRGEVIGEVVFTTAMTGYLETLTDQSYYGQIVIQTFPLIGNYGIISEDFESSFIGAKGYIVKHPCQEPSNFRSEGSLDAFLKKKGITGLCGIDTRALTKIIRNHGVMNGIITSKKPSDVNLENVINYKICNAVQSVSTKEPQLFKSDSHKYTVALLDYGIKNNIRRELVRRGCDVFAVPCESNAKEIAQLNPDGIMLSNGPGDPSDNTVIIENLKEITKLAPTFGICLGHQLLALANGFNTKKLKYGHRGANQPVKDMQSGRVYISSQNHGYAVESESIDTKKAEEWFVNVNDKTCEGIRYKNIPAFSVQFHPEACGGPKDTSFLFDKFIKMMEDYKNAAR